MDAAAQATFWGFVSGGALVLGFLLSFALTELAG